jgi:hypothetical protein
MKTHIISRKLLAASAIATSFVATTCGIGRADTLTSEKAVTTMGGPQFNIEANADGMTANQRAQIIQHKLDTAVSQAKSISPTLVSVQVVNNNPVVTFNGTLIATADGNSASRLGVSQMALAEQWAGTLRNYLQTLEISTKQVATTRTVKTEVANLEEVAVIPREMTIPIQLTSCLQGRKCVPGQAIEAFLPTDVPLGPSFKTYLPAGSRVLGELDYASKYAPNHYGGVGAMTPHFYAIKTPDGREIPIDAYIEGDIRSWKDIHIKPVVAESAERATKLDLVVDRIALKEELKPSSGEIVGGWRGPSDHYDDLGFTGLPSYRSSSLNYNGLIIPRNSRAVIPDHAPMLMRTATTSSVAVATRVSPAM